MSFAKTRCAIPMIHWIHGIKTALAAGLCLGITTFYHLDFGYWAVITTVIVMQVYVADSIQMCLYRFSGTIIGAVLGIASILIFPDTPLYHFPAVMVPVGILSFMTHYNTRYRMAAITAVIIIMTGISAPNQVSFALFRIIEITIGLFCAFLVSVLVFPVRLVDVLRENLRQQTLECCEKYDILVAAFLNGQEPVDKELLAPLGSKVWKNHELFENIRHHEALIYHKKFGKNLKTIVASMDTVIEHLKTMVRNLNATTESGFDILMKDELRGLAQASQVALTAMVENSPDLGIQGLADALERTEKKLHALRSKGVTTRFDLHKPVQVYSFYHAMHYLAQDLMQSLEAIKENQPSALN
ncbi:conserved hypothetical protein [Desulforapulum autotrophicum HRM2]|uniref:FUSC family protein n=1 Tax=Desulforapulum autotrophicum (strain ATCC 43914 / DSM 3382 / VKM B-1955 / HRM2) TaxID=177437 RepID=C0QM92_DESAH|nr:FUSC family protein [Desulforapulum autotrophicum]ACN16409.1 conserved hypothetical protein [Desulforapulum autotrophicum HRM2]